MGSRKSAPFAPSELITPDDIQGRYPTLREAVLKHGWPTLGASRGRFVPLDDGRYLALTDDLRRRLEGFAAVTEPSPALSE